MDTKRAQKKGRGGRGRGGGEEEEAADFGPGPQ